MNAQKNWSDRADRDLFFSILQVKDISVIGGAEWSSIGNAMRTLGYVFTNEGCRQHFQRLRRQQLESEVSTPSVPTSTNISTSTSTKNPDPALNPITRRPGPGRGRPKKPQANGTINASKSQAPAPAGSSGSVSRMHHHASPHPVSPPHINPQLTIDDDNNNVDNIAPLTAQPLVQHVPVNVPTTHINGNGARHDSHRRPPSHAVSRVQQPAVQLHHPRPTDDHDGSDEHQQQQHKHPAKRLKVESELDDEIALALVAEIEPGALDHYQFAAYPDP